LLSRDQLSHLKAISIKREKLASRLAGFVSAQCCFRSAIGRNSLLLGLTVLLFQVSLQTFAVGELVNQRMVNFDHLNTEEGLSQNGVTSFAQDSDGMIWIGTQEGLNRYDGYDFKVFYHSENDAFSLSHDQVHALLAGSLGRMWIGTDAGLDLYDPILNKFIRHRLDFPGEPGREIVAVFSLAEGLDGSVWIGTNNGLVRFKDGQFSWYKHDLTRPDSIGKGGVRALFVDEQGLLWVGTEEGGLTVLDAAGLVVRHYKNDPSDPNSIPASQVRAIQSDALGRKWVGTMSQGIGVLDQINDEWIRLKSRADDTNSLSSNRVRAIIRDASGSLWIGADAGLNLWKPETNDFQRFRSDLRNPKSISDETIIDLFEDLGGVIWVGTYNGISKWNATVETFPVFKLQSSSENVVSSPSTSSFAEDESGDLWIGTFEGISIWRQSQKTTEVFDSPDLGPNGRRVMAVKGFQNEIWAGTMANGIHVLRDEMLDRVYLNDASNMESLSIDAVTRIYVDRQERLWVATYGGGVNLYLGNDNFRRYPVSNNPHGQFSSLQALDIIQASDGNMWIATNGGGVIVLDPDTGDTLSFMYRPDDSSSLSSNNIVSLLETDKGIWIGTRDRGVSFYSPESGAFSHYTKADGLASGSVYGLLEDSAGKIWISGGKGLTSYDPASGKFEVYDSTHGLQSDDFNSGAYLKLENDLLLFGGNNGFNLFDPEDIRIKNTHLAPVVLTEFSKFNKNYPLPQALSETEELILDYTDSVIGFKFAVIDFTAPKKNDFKYRLLGFDDDWIDANGEHRVTYTNLDAGNYIFELMGSNNDGLWNEAVTSISVRVEPPPWETWWAYFLYFVAVSGALYLLLQSNSRRQRFEAEKRYSQRLQLYIESLEEATDCIMIADPDGVVLYANHAVESMFGLAPKDAQGQQLLPVIFNHKDEIIEVRHALASHGRYNGEVSLQGDSQGSTAEVTIASVSESGSESESQGSALVCISRDISLRKKTEAELEDYRRNLENLVAERSAALQKEILEHKYARGELAESLREKELLLKEVHHRVKNNMQVISSLLNMQADSVVDEGLSNLLGESQHRIKSMSLIHENLYQSENLLSIDVDDYIRMLADSLCRFYVVPNVEVCLNILVDDVHLDLETAVPCGLILNELVSNALKHAFKDRQGIGNIDIEFAPKGDNYRLHISDDGNGLPAEFELGRNASMGMEIVSILTEQLEGSLEIKGEPSASFTIEFPREKR
jgi:PAS domain S-box-containing protein